MPYQLHKDESLGEGLKRIADEEIACAIEGLRAPDASTKGIYEARKSLKRARAILRLLEPQLGPVYVAENRKLRDVARCFSALRDANVSLELLETLSKQYKRKSTLNPQRSALIERQKALEQQTNWHEQVAEALRALAGTRRRIEDWPLQHLTRDLLESQMKKTHKQSRQALKRVAKTRTAEDFHGLRKSVKRELNQMRLLGSGAPQVRDLKHLSSLLGDHHNLAVLQSTLQNTSGRFRQMTRRQQKHYEAEVLALAARVYSPVPAPELAPADTVL